MTGNWWLTMLTRSVPDSASNKSKSRSERAFALAVAMVRPSGENARRKFPSMLLILSPVSMFHTLIHWLAPALARTRLSVGEKLNRRKKENEKNCGIVRSNAPVVVSHTQMVPSIHPLASRFPSAENDKDVMPEDPGTRRSASHV